MGRYEAMEILKGVLLNTTVLDTKAVRLTKELNNYEVIEALKVAVNSLKAWDKVKRELSDLWLEGYSPHTEVIEILERNLGDV